ncbi:leukemia inhibitory factor receptor [Salminus brasiliensis]|uniref:leukemia inhibitory factor receptor n=1 Tax=Salminus brasiliensis TaxID=930266 RepID=UPI003B835E36
MHEVQVARTSRFELLVQENVSAGAPFCTWVWTSSLPLPCADHSVRVRRVFNSTIVSAWSEWATNNGQQSVSSSRARLFPTEEVLQEGSPAHCCCIPPTGAQVTEILFRNMPYPLIPVDSGVQAIQVGMVNSSIFGVNLICRDSRGTEQRVLNYVTLPPERPENLSCWTADLRSVRCSWTAGRRLSDLSDHRHRQYTLHIQGSGEAEVQCGSDSQCVFPVIPNRSFYNISVWVRNSLGEESQSDAFNISHRVFPVPEHVFVEAGVRDAELSWFLSGNFAGLHFTCQFTLEPTGTTTELQLVVPDPEQRLSMHLQPLQASCQYSTRGRCALQGNSWGPWSPTSSFSTEPLVTVDVWMVMGPHAHNRSVTVLWKTCNSGSDSNIEAFEVCVEQSVPRRRVCVNVTERQVEFTVGSRACNMSVRAVTHRGSSMSSQISIPRQHSEHMLREKRIVGNSTGFLLSWSAASSVTCGYTVEWSLLDSVKPHDIQWRKLSANQTSLFLGADTGFRKGRRYTFKIYCCQTEGYQAHEKHTGYLEEQKPLSAPELLQSLSVSWSSVTLEWSFNEDNHSHPGFITGYTLTILTQTDCDVFNTYVEDPHCKSVLVEGLQEGQLYTVRLAACTRAGCGVVSIRTITTRQNYHLLLAKVVAPLLVLIGCCICLWPCRKVLRGIAVDIFSLPSDHSLKLLELNDSLYEVSEKLRVLQVEDCKWCNLEVVDVKSSLEEKAWLMFTGDDCKPAEAPLSDPLSVEELVWDALAGESVTSVTNLAYLSGLQVELLSDSPVSEPSGYVRAEDPEPNTSDYVTSVTTVAM